ncbi:MAG: hypothetical protein ACOY3J_10405 [Bacillota bacterium]|uniref:DUF1440 domain-containing protein n=1 Tax=Thermanaerosceptrum fracticalcis TaxID=1712410 RepID=A0A7G6E282_THEFR|nr:hypothetical protein [Thermanaerosceptrum fracticalcis]QNB46186.1 hypothetical protein BR63_07575 [Thermanaerosceptrum fracticalcis]
MFKIKDRIVLGVVAGLAGNAIKMAIDEVSIKKKISQRSFRKTAAGVWVSKQSEATNIKGQILGGLLDFGMGILGGIASVYLLSKTGRDHIVTKGITSGITMGSFITFILGALPTNQVRPTDAASNLSYMASHAVYGLVTTAVAAKLGHPSLFDTKPQNDYLKPSEPTTEQIKSNVMPIKSKSCRTERKQPL